MRRPLSLVVLPSLIIPLSVGMTLTPASAASLPVQGHATADSANPPGPKGPHVPKPVKIACTALSGNAASSANPPTISGCNHSNVTGGSGVFPAGGLGASGATTVSWQSGGSTSIQYSSTVPQSKGDKCGPDPTSPGNKETEVILHGSVQPPGSGGVKGAVRARICLTSTLDMSLLSGQFKL